MISLQLPSQHVSSYATSLTHPTVQSSYDYASSVCNPQSWASVAPYPSPPMSSSPTATAHYANHAERAFDPNYTRMRSQPTMGADLQFWPQPTYHQHVYPQHAQPAPQQMTTLPLHQARSPRMQHAAVAAPYLPPLPLAAHVTQPYPTFAQSQQARDYVPQQGGYPSAQTQSTPSSLVMVSSGSKIVNKPVRRTKQHVQTACFNCKKAHLSCDVGRPCNRCKQSGKQDSCYNVAHKRRGRPRLRDTFGNKIVRQPEPPATGPVVPGAVLTASAPRRRSDPSLRVLKSQSDTRQLPSNSAHAPPDSFMAPNMTANLGFARPLTPTSPVAFLDLDLTVVRTNTFFNTIFGLEPDNRARILDSFIDTHDLTRLQDIRTKLREDKDARAPAYLAPLRMNGTREADNIPMVDMVDLSSIINQGFQEMNAELRMRFAGGTLHNVRINVRLAKTEVFFAVLILPPISEIIPSYSQQLARPMPSPGPNYTFGSGYPHGYGVSDVSLLTSRGSVSTSAPASPYYTYAPTNIPSAPSSRLSGSQASYDSSSMYFPQNMQTTTMYGYTPQNGVPSPAMTGGTEPRHFQGYVQEPQQMQMQFQTPGGQQILPPSYQLPPINAQGERPRSVASVPSTMATMRTDAYGRDHQQAYMNLRDDGHPQVDGSQSTSGSTDRGRGPHLTNLLQ